MIKLTYAQLSTLMNQHGLMGKLFNTPMRAQLSYKIKKIFDDLGKMWSEIAKEHKAYQEANREKFVVKNEDGSFKKAQITIKNEDGSETKKDAEGDDYELIPGQEKAFQENEKEFGSKTFTIERQALSIDDYSNTDLKFSMAEIDLLEPLFTEAKPENTGDAPDNVKKLHA